MKKEIFKKHEGYMKKNVNYFLLFLIILLIASFVVFTIYYKSTYQGLSKTFFGLKSTYETTAEELSLRRAQLNATLREFETKSAREESLSGKYADIRDVNAQLTGDLATTRKELADAKTELANTKSELESKKAQLITLQDEVSSLKSTIDNLKEDVDSICESLHTLGGSNGNC